MVKVIAYPLETCIELYNLLEAEGWRRDCHDTHRDPQRVARDTAESLGAITRYMGATQGGSTRVLLFSLPLNGRGKKVFTLDSCPYGIMTLYGYIPAREFIEDVLHPNEH
jgi:hypothetical protein